MTVEDLKIGSKLILGKYGVRNDAPYPIVWLKAEENCDFITESVLDYICFDAMERGSANFSHRYCGNSDYNTSNIVSFLNSDSDSWYRQMHEKDTPPDSNNVTIRNFTYENHYGFLYHFEEYELDSIVHRAVRLPAHGDVLGGNMFRIFHKKGIRAKGTEDMLMKHQSEGFKTTSFIDFWLSDMIGDRGVETISRAGVPLPVYPCNGSGLRPVCRLNPKASVLISEDGYYYIEPQRFTKSICTEDEILKLLGVARP